MLAHPGHLKLHPLRAHVKREGQGKMHPYVEIEFNGDKWKSSHHEGHNVEWNGHEHWEHKIHEAGLDHVLTVKLMDHEGIFHSDEGIGHCKFEVKRLCHHNKKHEWEEEVIIEHAGMQAGHIIFRCHFEPHH